jgi:cell wall-associated NlpC family hydrolase
MLSSPSWSEDSHYCWSSSLGAGHVYYVVNQITGGGQPRSLAGQATSGSSVDPHELQPGDLVFFQNTCQAGLSHAGIYVGNGQFVNAANESTRVILSNLWDSYWGPRFETARRIG